MPKKNHKIKNALSSYNLAYEDNHGWQLWVPSTGSGHSYNIGEELYIKAVHLRSNGTISLARFNLSLPEDPTVNLNGNTELTPNQDTKKNGIVDRSSKVWNSYTETWTKYDLMKSTELSTARTKINENLNLLRDVAYGENEPLQHDTPKMRSNGNGKSKHSRAATNNGNGHPDAKRQTDQLVGLPASSAASTHADKIRRWYDKNQSHQHH